MSEVFDHKRFLQTVSRQPGVYRMYDDQQVVIYVGKAKNLKNRLSSYFQKNISSVKTQSLVKRIANIEVTITDTETEALVLENNLIKQFQPKYNILLRDDKSYPYLLITEQTHPRIAFHRGSKKIKGEYFGPFPSSGAVWETLKIIQKLFPVRQCEDGFYAARSRPCLQHQLKRCLAPCVEGYTTDDDYLEQVKLVKQFLNGQGQSVIDGLIEKMEHASGQLQFEKAAQLRDQISAIRKTTERQHVSGKTEELDVIAFAIDKGLATVHVLYVREQKILGSKNFTPKLPANAELNEIMAAFIEQFYLNGIGGQSIPSTVVIPQMLEEFTAIENAVRDVKGKKLSFVVPKQGEKFKYLNLAMKNAEAHLATRIADGRTLSTKYRALAKALGIERISHMECFDISHTFGDHTVASCVVFGAEGPNKSKYRRYNVKGITAGDDYAAMSFALNKRFSRVTDSTQVPDILFIDGGLGQVGRAEAFFADWTLEKRPIIVGVAKGESRKPGLETLILDGGKTQVHLDKTSDALHLIQYIRDESHRFAITGHRQKRQKAATTSVLQDIPGIGAKRRQALLKNFGGLQGLKNAQLEQIAKVPGISTALAEQIYDYLHPQN